jgi:hypothetical protein
MQFTVEYDDGVWIFTVTSDDDEPEYLEEFEITNLGDAIAAAGELIEEIKEAAEAEDEEDEGDVAFEDFLSELDE